MSSNPNDLYNDKELAQYRGRTHASLYNGPTYGASGNPYSVMKHTVSEIPFSDSESALKFMNQVGVKDPNARVVRMKARTRFISRDDDKDE